jgi:putative DNA primase/helicase
MSASSPLALALTPMSGFTRRPINWLWDQRLAVGKLSIIAGDPGLGKSFLTLDLAARVSRDGIMPDGYQGPTGDVLLISAEDDPCDTLQPRLEAAGARLDRIHFVRGVHVPAVVSRTGTRNYLGADEPRFVDKVHKEASVNAFVLGQIGPLRETMAKVRPKLIVIDPITAYLGECDSNNNAQVRALLAPLSQLAGEFECCVIAVSHLNKSPDGGSKAMYRTMGSLAFVAAARSAWLVTKMKASPERRIFAQIKNNLGRERKAISFTVADNHDGEGLVEWDPTEIDLSADEAVADRQEMGRPDEARSAATEFLTLQLTNGGKMRSELFKLAWTQGITASTLERAAREMNLKKTIDEANRRQTLWELPDGATPPDDISASGAD